MKRFCNFSSCLFFWILIVNLLVSCGKDDTDDLITYQCPECDCDSLIAIDEDVLPTLEVPVRTDPKVIVLLYHNLVYGRTGSEYHRDVYNFENDLAYLRKNFKVIDLYDLDKINRGEMTLHNDAVVITFDDGDLSIYPLAFPLLKKYNFKATFFIISSLVGEVGYVDWNQLKTISSYRNKQGIQLFSFGSHTVHHVDLGTVSPDEASVEMSNSRQVISNQLGIPVDFIAFPYGGGAEDPLLISMAKEAGYKGIRTSLVQSIEAFPTDMYHLPGVNIDNGSHEKFVNSITALLHRQ